MGRIELALKRGIAMGLEIKVFPRGVHINPVGPRPPVFQRSTFVWREMWCLEDTKTDTELETGLLLF